MVELDILENRVYLVSISPSHRKIVLKEVEDYITELKTKELKIPEKLYNWIDYLNGV